MSTPTLPAKFLYYKNCSDPYVAEVSVTQGADGVYSMLYTPTMHIYHELAPTTTDAFWMTVKVKTTNGSVVSKRIYTRSESVKNMTNGEYIKLITFSSPRSIFGPYVLKRNKYLYAAPQAVPTVSPAVSVTAPAAPLPVAPAPAPKPVKKKVSAVGDLSPFVAKQLLELAQTKHEMCPIVAEEFATGHTAAMPCGHLFADFAIKETFKKEPNKCPVCRVYGAPTYV
jgi:hypothetical protein